MAMARPRRPGSERVAVRAAAAGLNDNLSASAKAAEVARLAIAAYLRDEKRTDAFDRALHDAQQRLDPDPVEALATGEDSVVAATFLAERVTCYRARDCRQLCERGWQTETRAIAETVEKRMARRFRDYLK